jgi:chromosome segregation ATPase
MTAYGKQIVVLAGEPSTATREAQDLAIVYLLDTSKIRYPNDQPVQAPVADPRARRPSTSDNKNGMGATRSLSSRDGSTIPDPKRLNGPPGRGTGQPGVNGNDQNGVAPGSAQPQGAPLGALQEASQAVQGAVQGAAPPGSKLPRASMAQTPPGPPPQQQAPNPRPNGPIPPGNGRGKPQGKPERGFGPAIDTNLRNPSVENISGSPKQIQTRTMSPAPRESPQPRESPLANGRRTPTQAQQVSKPVGAENNAPPVSMNTVGTTRTSSKTRTGRQQSSIDSTSEQSSLRNVTNVRQTSPPPPTRQTSNPLVRKGSARNSQTVALLKELDAAKNRNAWYASELELARKAGYVPNPSSSPILDQRAAESFDDDDKPLIEALIAMKNELANVQGSIDKQAVLAAKQIAEVEKQRDAAVSEAVYAKAKLAAHTGSQSSTPQPDADGVRDLGVMSNDRSTDISRKLASALAEQRDLQSKLEMLTTELDAEKRGRKLAEDTSNSCQNRISELEMYKQQNSSEVEQLKAELHEFQKKAREEAIVCADAVAAAQLLQADKDELEGKYQNAMGSSKDHSETFESLREAIASSADMRNLLEGKLDEERTRREKVETKLSKLKAEHENRVAELETATRRLRDAEELAEQHAAEARTHRQAVLSGLDRVAARDVNSKSSVSNDRIAALQAQAAASNALVRKYQQAADTASEKLRSAEERIAGLEAYQEQASREGMSIRKQLQSTMREVQTLQAANSEMKYQLANQQLETNAVHVQHNTLKDILGERGISPSGAARARGLSSPQSGANTPDLSRLRELEQQLATSVQAHQETKQTLEAREQEAEVAYREKLTQLENDYQSAVHYVKGTEKMLKRMKDELAKYKSDNTRLKEQLSEAEGKGMSQEASSGWEAERASLNKQIESLQADIKTSVSQLERQMAEVKKELAAAQQERDQLKNRNEETQRQLSTSTQQARSDLAQLQQENVLLERRAQDAEQKVSLLLDQVEQSVDTYRRQSRQVDTNGGPGKSHERTLSTSESVSESSLYDGGNRNSTALDSLANELETLRSHWENTNKNYRLSNAFEFEERTPITRGPNDTLAASNAGDGLSGSLADWRKRLDSEEELARSRKGGNNEISPGGLARQREMNPSEVGQGAAGKSQVNLI